MMSRKISQDSKFSQNKLLTQCLGFSITLLIQIPDNVNSLWGDDKKYCHIVISRVNTKH